MPGAGIQASSCGFGVFFVSGLGFKGFGISASEAVPFISLPGTNQLHRIPFNQVVSEI